jgi:hypothetical protein
MFFGRWLKIPIYLNRDIQVKLNEYSASPEASTTRDATAEATRASSCCKTEARTALCARRRGIGLRWLQVRNKD